MSMSPRLLRPRATGFDPRSIPGLALWLDASATGDLYTTDAGPVTAVAAPTEIAGCLCWYDAADASSITKDGSNLVSQWNDKSGNGRHATASGSLRPTSGGSQNGRTVMQFTGTQAMSITGNFLQSDNVTMFAVAMKNTDHYGGIISSAPTNPEDSPVLCFYLTTIAWLNRRVLVQQAIGNSVYRIVSGQSVGTAQQGWFDGVRGADATASVATNTANTITKIGALRTSSTADLNGNIAEIVCYSGNLSVAQRASVESYLAAKWGISGVHAAATSASDPVGYWRDRSGNERHATQATASYRGVVGTQGSRRAITLDGTDDHLLLGNLSAVFPTAGEVVAAYALNAVDTAYTVYQTSDNLNSDVFGGITFAGAFRNSRLAGLSFTGPSSVGTHLWGVSSASAGYNLWVEGSNALTTTADHTGGNNHAIGMRSASPGSNQAMNGKLLEVCAFNRALASSERLRLNRYLAAKWGIVLAPQVPNADAQDWVNRVYANGGTVTSSTASAVNQFCNDIDAAGIRDRFYRLGLFAGAGLNACLVPLYRGPSLGGTQYGNTTDTNVGPFVSGDYVEAGASGGLTGNGSSKYLNTGLNANSIGTEGHAAIYHRASIANAGASMLRVSDGASHIFGLDYSTGVSNMRGFWGSTATVAFGSTSGGLHAVTRRSATDLEYYRNGASVGTQATSVTPTAPAQPFFVFASNQNGTPGIYSAANLQAYSLGLSMTAAQAAAYYTAMQAFQTALGRNV